MFSVIIFKDKNIYSKTHYLADYRSDIESLPTNSTRGTQGNSSATANNLCLAGSRCKVCEDGSVWILNNQGEWVEQPVSSSGSGSSSGDTIDEITADEVTEMWG